jgi:hypothetical protein
VSFRHSSPVGSEGNSDANCQKIPALSLLCTDSGVKNRTEQLEYTAKNRLRITIGRCVNELELIAEASEARELANRVEYLPL